MPMATRAGTKRAASSEPDREGHQHIVIRSELGSNNRTVWNLTPGRHTPAELVHAARSFFDHGTDESITVVRVTPFQPPVMTKTSRLPVVEEDFQWVFQLAAFEEPNRTVSSKEVHVCVQRAFNLFDNYFFFNQIQRYTKFRLVQGLAACHKKLGVAANDPSKGQPYQLIKLDYQSVDAPDLNLDARTANMKKILGVLLHEMRVAREQFDGDLNLQCDEDGPSVGGFREGLNKRRRTGS